MTRLTLASLLAAGALATPALAQDDPQANVPIVVLGTGLPLAPGTPAYGTVTIDRDRLTSASSGLLEDALSDVAGFGEFRRSDSRSANPSAQGVTLRALGGNAASRTLMLLDGVPMADPFFGFIPYTALAPDRLGAVRVTRGGGVGAFGAGAVAGTIELESAARAQLPLLDASGLYGSRNASELSATLSPDLGAGYVSVSGRRDRGDGFYTTPPNQRVAATVPARYDSWSSALRAVTPVSGDGELQARLLVFRDDGVLRFAGQTSHSEGEDASLRYVSRGRWQVDALAYVQARSFSAVTVSATSFRPTLNQRNTPSTGLGGKIEIRPPLGANNVLRLGGDVRVNDGHLDETPLSGATGNPTLFRRAGGTNTALGGFVEDDWTLGSVVLTAGARADHWTIRSGFLTEMTPAGMFTTNLAYPDRSGWEGSFRGGAVWRLVTGVSVRAAAYTGYRLPTLNELYRGFTVSTIFTQANPNLAPERLKGFEGGLDLTVISGISLSVTGFHNRLGNAIANVTIGPNLRKRFNVDAIVANGVEVTADARFGKVDLSASYAYDHSEVEAPATALDGLAPAQSPRNLASATLAWTPRPGWRFSATLRHTGMQYEDDLQANRIPPATTLGAYAALPLGRGFSLIGRAENLFDAAIVTRNSGGTIDLGAPRTLWIGIRIGV